MDPYEVVECFTAAFKSCGCALNLKDDLLVLYCSVLLGRLQKDWIYVCDLKIPHCCAYCHLLKWALDIFTSRVKVELKKRQKELAFFWFQYVNIFLFSSQWICWACWSGAPTPACCSRTSVSWWRWKEARWSRWEQRVLIGPTFVNA